MSHSLALITVVYENYTLLDDFISSLKKQTDRDFKVFVVDSSPQPKNLLLPSFCQLIKTANKGYAHGLNVGEYEAKQQGYTSFCFMNNDVFFEKEFVSNVKKSIKEHPSTLIGGKIYYAPGYEYHKDRYSPRDKGRVLWYAGGSIDWKNAYTPHIGVDLVDKGQFDEPKKITFVTGCLMCFDKDVLDTVGSFDESYFMFYEDADFSARVKKQHLTLLYDPTIILWHKSGQSSDGAGSQTQVRFQKRSMLLFGLKHAPLKTKIHLLKNFFFSKN